MSTSEPSQQPDPRDDIFIDTRALCLLRESLTRLEEAGGKLGRDNSWFKPMGWDSQSLQRPTKADLDLGIGHLQALKSVRGALLALTGDMEATIATRQKDIIPLSRHLGLFSLPAEIFLQIFQQLMYSYQNSYEDFFEGAHIVIRDLSLVNRQFRSMLIAFTDVWTFLDLSRYHGEVLEQYICRSKQAPLSVRLRYTAGAQQDIHLAMVHKHRWQYLDATFDSSYIDKKGGSSNDTGLITNLPLINFQSIKFLRLHVEHDDLYYQERCAIFSNWSFPNAMVVELVDDIPDVTCLVKLEAATTFKYISTLYGLGGGVFLNWLTCLLKSSYNLQTVHLDISHVLDPDSHDLHFEVELPNVTDFTITNWRQYEFADLDDDIRGPNPDEFAQIIRAFRIPNVESIYIFMIFFGSEFDLEDWVPLAFPAPCEWGSVSYFSFNVRRYGAEDDDPTPVLEIDELLRPFPALYAFSIDAGGFHITGNFNHPTLDLHDLRVLQIDNCGDPPDVLYNILRDMKAAGVFLEELEISSQSVFNLAKLKEVAPCACIQVTEAKDLS